MGYQAIQGCCETGKAERAGHRQGQRYCCGDGSRCGHAPAIGENATFKAPGNLVAIAETITNKPERTSQTH